MTVFCAIVDGQGSKLTVIRQKVGGPDEGIVKVDGLRILISGRIKADGPKVLKGAVQEF